MAIELHNIVCYLSHMVTNLKTFGFFFVALVALQFNSNLDGDGVANLIGSSCLAALFLTLLYRVLGPLVRTVVEKIVSEKK